MIEAQKATYPITMMCRLLDVPRSTYYDWAGRADTVTATAARRAAVAEAVESVFDEYRQTYGCRRIAHVLNTERGIPVSVGTVADIMRERGLAAVQPRAYKTTTVADNHAEYPTDAIGRDFTAQAPGDRLVGDITYLRTGQGWGVPGHRDRSVHPDGGGLGDRRAHARQPGLRRPAHGL